MNDVWYIYFPFVTFLSIFVSTIAPSLRTPWIQAGYGPNPESSLRHLALKQSTPVGSALIVKISTSSAPEIILGSGETKGIMCKEKNVLSGKAHVIISTVMYQGGATASMHNHGHLRPHSTHRSQATPLASESDIPTGVVPKLLRLRPCYSHRRKDYGHLINTTNHNPTVNLGVGKNDRLHTLSHLIVSSFRRFSSLAHLIGPIFTLRRLRSRDIDPENS